ncbi:MAG: hypothetical protein AABW50_03625 [Nanoarchaeota archaeon]
MAKKQSNMWGSWAFLIGVILAVVFGLAGVMTSTLMIILVIIGLLVGLLNIGDEEVQPFLMSGAVLIIAAAFGQQAVGAISFLENILSALLIVFVPATIIVALKNVFSMARK